MKVPNYFGTFFVASPVFSAFSFGHLRKKCYLCTSVDKPRLMIEESIVELDIFEEKSKWIACEEPCRDIAVLLEDLLIVHGSAFVNQLKLITTHRAFYPVKGETDIYSTGGDRGEDYENLLSAARKAVEHGYRVFILPNPKGIRTADFIFERKGVYKMFDLKTISGSNSVDNRLRESIGQTNRVLLHIVTNYEPRPLAKSIKHYFEKNVEAKEVLVIKSKKIISVIREDTLGESYIRNFMKKYKK